jgi:hypothetical protein
VVTDAPTPRTLAGGGALASITKSARAETFPSKIDETAEKKSTRGTMVAVLQNDEWRSRTPHERRAAIRKERQFDLSDGF